MTVDLNLFTVNLPPGVMLIDAYQINNAGQILGTGFSPSSGSACFVLAPVPEAAGLCLHAAIVASLARSPRRRVP